MANLIRCIKTFQAEGIFLVFVNFFTEAVPKITQLLSLPSNDSSISFVKQSLGSTPPCPCGILLDNI